MTINRTIFSNYGVHSLTEEEDYLPTDEDLANHEQLNLTEANNSNRSLRNFLLSESDWTQGSDTPLTDAKKLEWATYRTLLRSLSDHENWPHLTDDDWPVKPT